jgi:PAS domain S-box-containing protein
MISDHSPPHPGQGIRGQSSIQNFTRTAAILTVLLFLSAAAIGWYAWIDEKADAVSNLTTITTLEAQATDGYFTHLNAALQGLAEDLTRQNEQINLDQAYLQVKRFREIHAELFNVTLIQPDGELLLTAKTAPGSTHASLAKETSFITYIDELKQGREQQIGQPLVGVVSNVVIVPLRYAIKDRQGKLRYILSANLTHDYLRSAWVEAPITAKAAIGLMRDNGFLLSRYPVPADLPLQQVYGKPRTGALINHLRETGFPMQGYVQGQSSLDGPDFLNVFHRLPNFSATLFVALPMSALRESWWKRVSGTYLVLLLLQIGGFVTYRYAVRRQTAWNAEHDRLEAAMRESEQRFRKLISHNNAIILQIEPSSGRILDANAAAEKFYGWSHDELCAMSIQDINQLDPEQVATERQAAATDQCNYFVFPHRLASGEIRTVEVHSTPITINDQAILVSIIHDITERKQVQDQVERLVAEQQAILKNKLIGIVTVRDRHIVWANPAFEAMLGYAQGELAGTPTRRNYSSEKTYLAFGAAAYSALSKGHTYRDEVEHVRKDGSRIYVDVSGESLNVATGESLWCFMDITDHKQAEVELEQHRHHLERLVEDRTVALSIAKEAAEAASRAKSMFLANISHELRTPMNGIMGMTGVALRRVTDPKTNELLGKAMASADRLLLLLNNLIDISKMEAERFTLDRDTFMMETVLDNLQTHIGQKAEVKGVHFNLDIAPEVTGHTLVGDPVRLGQVLATLIENAIKFTDDGSVTLRAQVAKETSGDVRLRFEVQDTGIGIAADDQHHLFTLFEQVDGSVTRKYGGTGLGLIICKRLVELMGGSIGVSSKIGEGSTFWFAVRLDKAG